ncbi:hypothetical protein AX769_01880 [Frondihabitans sp. PAMC 28766]|uniref:mycothiol transferase n=1 Tax=Frondihabitans sp. PAMC 28766 TaxID=1795630 RepID=UPI00078C18D3|nr:DinB family protein [Frondihabitans sp. PAMC 28766]AMM19113.1 hypothetical protein AX769_01880 [Frondihabitans sp. PAMC 28766]
MTPSELLTDSFTRIPAIVERATDGLDAQRLGARPAVGTNTIAWLAWHIARGQDVQVADLAASEQVWTADDWYGRFNLPFGPDEMGYGMSAGDVARVVAPADLLTGYLAAVTARTVAYLATVTESDLDDVIDTNWNPPVTRGSRLVSIVGDCLQHAGQASYARGILDRL